MNIRELILAVNEHQDLSEAKPKVKQDTSGNWVNAETGEPVQPAADNTVEFPKQAGAQAQQAQPEQPQAQAGTAGSAASTMDPRVAQPIDAEPEKPKKTFAQKLGTVAANVGAIPGAFKGIKTAYQKGKADMAARVGGPVNQPGTAGSAPSAGGAAQAQDGTAAPQGAAGNVDSELADLRQMINRIDAKLAKAGIKQ